MTSLRTAVAMLAVASVTACGARSQLSVGHLDASGGAGTSSSGSASAGGGGAASSSSASTGAGGGLPPCNTLALAPPIASPASPLAGVQEDLALTSVSGDDQVVAGIYYDASEEEYFGFSPWTTWPADGVFAPTHHWAIQQSGPAIATPSASPGRIAVALQRAVSMVFAPDIEPNADGLGPGGSTDAFADATLWLAGRPVGAAGPTHLAGVYRAAAQPSLESYYRVHGLLLPAGIAPKDDIDLGCGSPGASGGAVPSGDGWLVAFTVSTPGMMSECPGPSDGSTPRFVKIAEVGADGSATTLAKLDRGYVIALRAVAHPDGMYVVWAEADDHGNGLGRAMRIGRDGSRVGPTPVAAAGVAHGGFAASTMGRRLALATQRPSGDIAVELYDESLALVSSTTYSPGGAFQGPTTALASPAGDQLLVGWAVREGPSRVQIARFDCAP